MNDLEARIVGRVYCRPTWLAFVTDQHGDRVRVMWDRRKGYKCAACGAYQDDNDCPHILAAAVAARWQRKAERDGVS